VVDFVEEVEERLRAERYAGLANRWLPWLAAALVVVIVGWLAVWGWKTWQDHNIGRASVAFDAAQSALASGDQTGAFTSLADLAKHGPSAYRAMALMTQGDIRLGAGKGAEAAALFDQSAKVAPNAIFGDLARLKAALALMDTAAFADEQHRLQALMGEKKPFDLQAREALAFAKLQAGQIRGARDDLNALTLTLNVPQGMRARAQAAIALIDNGEAGRVAQVVKLAATLPPPAAANQSLSLGAMAPSDGSDADGDGASDQGPPPAGEAAPAPNS
jgi:hypothetical protein